MSAVLGKGAAVKAIAWRVVSFLRKRFATVVIIGLALVLGVWAVVDPIFQFHSWQQTKETQRQWDEAGYGVNRSGTERYILHQFTLNALSEAVVDRDGNGMADGWYVSMWAGSPAETSCQRIDTNGDGAPDKLLFCRGPADAPQGAMYRAQQSLLDGASTEQTFALAVPSQKGTYRTYTDFDSDGTVDMIMVNVLQSGGVVVAEEGWIVTGNQLLGIDFCQPFDNHEAWVTQNDGSVEKMIFRDHTWQPIPAPTPPQP